MKKIILTTEQAKYLTENQTVNISAQSKDNSKSGFVNAATNPNTVNDVNKASTVASDVNLVINGPNSNDSQPQQIVNVANGDTVQNAIAKQTNDALIQKGGSVIVKDDGYVSEGKVFNKKTIEEGRLENMRKNGRIYSKKELTKRFEK